MVENELPSPPKNKSNKKNLTVLDIVLILIIGVVASGLIFALYLSQFQGIVPAPTPTPTPIADVVLSPNYQVVVLSLGQIPSFSLTISQNGHGNVVFPCSVTIIPFPQDTNGQVTGHNSYSIATLDNYGTINSSSTESWVPISQQPETILYYAVIQDSTGAKIRSNTVGVEYK